MRILVTISRILVGSLFIVSGLIKANDALGFSYKMEEYFSPKALGFLDFLAPYALPFAIAICVVEIVLGLAVLFGSKMKIVSWLLLLMILFFSWLTFYTATCDPFEVVTTTINGELVETTRDCVKECGCFGNAIPLTPWESFSKDIVLLVFILILFINRNKIELNQVRSDVSILPFSLFIIALFSHFMLDWWFPVWFSFIAFLGLGLLKNKVQKPANEWAMAAFASVLSLAFSLYTYSFLPIKDYRPYAEGMSIPEQMVLPEGAKPSVFKNYWIYNVNGVEKEYTDEEEPWNIEGAEFVDRTTKLIEQGDEPTITDFELTDSDGVNVTQQVLEEPIQVLVIAYDLTKAETSIQSTINEFAAVSEEMNVPFAAATASLYEEIEAFRHANQNAFPYYSCDGITLKTIVRSNPGIIVLKNGVVVKKWHHNTIPTKEEFKAFISPS